MDKMTRHSSHVISPRRSRPAPESRMEWRVVDIPRDITQSEARSLLTEQAEYGRWELVRSQRFIGGARKVWLRRRTMLVRRTDHAA